MLRAWCLAVIVLLGAGPSWANARVTILMDVLRMEEVVGILRDEGFSLAQQLNQDMLDGRGGAFWKSQIKQIYDTERIKETLRRALEIRLDAEDVDAASAYYSSEEGARIITLENAARRALADRDVEAAAQQAATALEGTDDPHFLLVQRFINENDLLERNVSGTMSSYIWFYKGLSDGRYLIQSEAEILQEVYALEVEIRADTTAWLLGFLTLAYQPLEIDTLKGVVDFSATAEGRALNRALFAGFEEVNNDISYALGRAIALNAKGDEI